ncbi:hypothetical protein N0B40_00590 [Chryseobacterium oranimense]|uniref:hypothetical protein n=1 Tax=Chryseobacterium oranimense TaxID=421058 RepID=UPI0021B01AA5|nr:hypothetical protein [Chryseobacterium oranimense]UWX60780.1 hypothetical protein N0B40_00590 [Chryseobacterium oranimense]
MKNVVYIIIYSLIYQFIHINFLYDIFWYAGYMNEGFSTFSLIQTLLFICIPLFVKKDLHDVFFLEVLYTIFYLLLYVPIMITFLNHYGTEWKIFINQLPFLAAFVIMFKIAGLKKLNIKKLNLKPPNQGILIAFTIFIIAVLFMEFRSTYSFVSFEDVYSQREKGSNASLVSGYFTLWLTYFIGPVLVAMGLIKKDKKILIFGTLSIIFVYGINASKIALFIPFLLIFLYYIKIKGKDVFKALTAVFSSVCLIAYWLPSQYFMISAVILMRTFGISGLLTYQYNEFFKENPFTYYSHINIVNFITDNYPYDQDLGFVVSSYFFESDNNANANFLATDGIASFGVIGVIIISIIFGIYMLYTKSLVDHKNSLFIGLVFISFSFIILNVGLFTSLLSGGFLFLNIYLYLYKS